MEYRVAVDTADNTTYGRWMLAAGQAAIPTAFIVSKEGTIAWIGHPGMMAAPLAEIAAGKSWKGPVIKDIPLITDRRLAPFEATWLTNLQRRKMNLPPLKENVQLRSAAQGHADDMARSNYFSHTSPSGEGPAERMRAQGYNGSYYAENIAVGARSAAEVVGLWMSSPGHRAAILNSGIKETTVALAASAGSRAMYWVQNFGNREVFPLIIDNEQPVTTTRKVNLYVYGAGTAVSMRFSDDGAHFGRSQAFKSEADYELPAGNGRKTVYVELSDRNGRTLVSSDDIELKESDAPQSASDSGETAANTSTKESAGSFAEAPKNNHTENTEVSSKPREEPASGSGSFSVNMESRALDFLNEMRRNNGLSEFVMDSRLRAAARRHCQDMARTRSLGETGSDGSTLDQRVAAAGWKGGFTSQIAAIGSDFAGDVVNAWVLRDVRARRLLTRRQYSKIGIAMLPGGQDKCCWVVVLGE